MVVIPPILPKAEVLLFLDVEGFCHVLSESASVAEFSRDASVNMIGDTCCSQLLFDGRYVTWDRHNMYLLGWAWVWHRQSQSRHGTSRM